MRFNLKWFLGLIAFVALLLAPLVRPSEVLRIASAAVVWIGITYTAMVVVVRRDERRGFAIGFLLVGLPYLVIAIYPPDKERLPHPAYAAEEFIARPIYHRLLPLLASRHANPGFIPRPSKGSFHWQVGRGDYTIHIANIYELRPQSIWCVPLYWDALEGRSSWPCSDDKQ
jgi:hypothetical protein